MEGKLIMAVPKKLQIKTRFQKICQTCRAKKCASRDNWRTKCYAPKKYYESNF